MNGDNAKLASCHGIRQLVRLAFQQNIAGVGSNHTGDNIDQCAFTSTVFPHQSVHFATPHVERNSVNRSDSGEAVRYVEQLEQF